MAEELTDLERVLQRRQEARVLLDHALEGDPRKLLALVDELLDENERLKVEPPAFTLDAFISMLYVASLNAAADPATLYMSQRHHNDLKTSVREDAMYYTHLGLVDSEFLGVELRVVPELDGPVWPVMLIH